jgi:hypothetical protein
MSIVTRPRPPVKPTRHAPRSAHPFREDIFSARTARFVPSDEDVAWAAYEFNKDATDFEVVFPTDDDLTAMAWAEALAAELDRMAGEFEALDRHERGLCL